jgi:hypothetical protein
MSVLSVVSTTSSLKRGFRARVLLPHPVIIRALIIIREDLW